MLGPKFDWDDDPLCVYITNSTDHDIWVKSGCRLGVAKPVATRAVANCFERTHGELYIIEKKSTSLEEPSIMPMLNKMEENDANEEITEGIYTIMEDERDNREAERDAIIKTMAKEVERQAIQIGEPYVPLKSAAPPSQKEIFEQLKVPPSLIGKIHASLEEQKLASGHAHLQFRTDGSREEQEAEIQRGIQKKKAHWKEMGRDKMIESVTFGVEMNNQQRRRAEDLIWNFRDCFGSRLSHIQVSILQGESGGGAGVFKVYCTFLTPSGGRPATGDFHVTSEFLSLEFHGATE